MLEEATVEEFGATLRGDIIRPEDEGYDEARKVYNAMIDKHPRMIARCSSKSSCRQRSAESFMQAPAGRAFLP